MSPIIDLKNKFTQAVHEMLVGVNMPGHHTAINEAATGFGFLTAVGAATFNPVLAGAGIAGLAVCASYARSAGRDAMTPQQPAPVQP